MPNQEELRKVQLNILDKNTGTAAEEVNPITSASSIQFADNRTLPEELKLLNYYTNSKPMPTDVGGIKAGTTFDNILVKDIIDILLYPYSKATISVIANPEPKLRENGDTVEDITFDVTVQKGTSNIKSVSIYKGDTLIGNFNGITEMGGSQQITYAANISSGEQVFTIRVIDEKGMESRSEKLIYKFINPIFVGSIDANIEYPDSNTISTTFTKQLLDDPDKIEYEYTVENKRAVVVYPKAWHSRLKDIKDPNGFVITNSYSFYDVNILLRSGVSVPYKVAVSNPNTNTNFKITLNF